MTTDTHSKTIFGFWVFLMSDCLLFASFFATYFVLHQGTVTLFSLPFAFTQSVVFLISSFAAGFFGDKHKTLALLGFMFVLGALFLSMMGYEFAQLVQAGTSWQTSGAWSAFFTLLSMVGLHAAVGLLWIVVLMLQICFRGITPSTSRRLACLKLFWQFLNIVWVFIFSFVYLLGAQYG